MNTAIPANPILRAATFEGISSRIERARALALATAPPCEVRAAISDCLRGYSTGRFLLSELVAGPLYRAVRSDGRDIAKVSHVGYPPPGVVLSYGRANAPRESVFYAASDRSTAVLEMRPKVGEHLVLSEWQPSRRRAPQVREIGLLETLERLVPDLAVTIKAKLQPSFAQDVLLEDRAKQRLIRRFLSEEFTKAVPPDTDRPYRVPAAIAAYLMHGSADGLVYASVASVQSGLNVVLHSRAVDQYYRLVRCEEIQVVGQIAEHQYAARTTRVSGSIEHDGSISWA